MAQTPLPILLSKLVIIGTVMLLIWIGFAMTNSPAGGTIGLILAIIIGYLFARWWILDRPEG